MIRGERLSDDLSDGVVLGEKAVVTRDRLDEVHVGDVREQLGQLRVAVAAGTGDQT